MNNKTEQIQEVLRSLFLEYEESLAHSGILLEAVPNYVGVQLDPELYIDGSEIHLKCNVRIEVLNQIYLNDNVKEEISDLVNDWLRSKQIDLELTKVGVDPEKFDWLPVHLLRV